MLLLLLPSEVRLAASQGPPLYPGTNIYPGTDAWPGQGSIPLIRCYVATTDPSLPVPSWTDASGRLRAYSVTRGRSSELDEFDAGTATAVLDNRDRAFDPVINSAVRPMNQVWLYEEWSGERQDLFHGYVESWQQNWDPSGIVDATATLQAVDEFKILSLGALPATDPARASYNDLIQYDSPASYWRWQDRHLARTVSIEIGRMSEDPDTKQPVFTSGYWYTDEISVTDWSGNAFTILNESPIVGDFSATGGGALRLGSGAVLTALSNSSGEAFGGQFLTVEFWFRKSGNPGTNQTIMTGPQAAGLGAGAPIWSGALNTTGQMAFDYLDGNIVRHGVTTSSSLLDNVWYHVVFQIDSQNATYVYLNGVLDNTGGFGPGYTIWGSLQGPMTIIGATGVTSTDFAEIAVYSKVLLLSSARIAAHYVAGTQRGYPAQAAGRRIGAILDGIQSHAPRTLQAGRTILQSYQVGQSPLDEMRRARDGDNGDAALFVSRDRRIVYLANDHRSSAPYNAVAATFDDDGTNLPYWDASLDFSESFLFNDWAVTGLSGVTQTASDATSQSRYFKRSRSLTGLLVDDSTAASIASAQLAKYKDPFTRFVSIKPNMADPETARVVFQRDLMDRIEVFRTPPGGGTRIDQVLFIQRITMQGTPGKHPQCELVVSPL